MRKKQKEKRGENDRYRKIGTEREIPSSFGGSLQKSHTAVSFVGVSRALPCIPVFLLHEHSFLSFSPSLYLLLACMETSISHYVLLFALAPPLAPQTQPLEALLLSLTSLDHDINHLTFSLMNCSLPGYWFLKTNAFYKLANFHQTSSFTSLLL